MPERKIDPKFNIHETYTRVNIVNPYRFGSGSGSAEAWADNMVLSYKSLNPEQSVWMDGYAAAESELHNRFVGMYDDFKNYTSATFIYFMEVRGNTTARSVYNVGAVLQWNMQGQIFNQNDLPAATLNSGDFISVTSTDDWQGINRFDLFSCNLKGACPFFNFPNLTRLYIYENAFTGTAPNFYFPLLTDFRLYSNQFSGTCPDWNLPKVHFFYIHQNQFSGTCPAFNFPEVQAFYLYENQFSGTVPNFQFPSVSNFRIFSNQFSGVVPNWNFPNVATIYTYANSFTSISGFDFVTIDLKDCRISYNSFDQTSVDGMLSALVAANRVTAGNIFYIHGGTSAAPSTSGQQDKQTLIDRGWTVITN